MAPSEALAVGRRVRTRAAGYPGFGRATCTAVMILLVSCSGFRTANQTGWHTVSIGLCEDYPEETRSLEKADSDLTLSRNMGATVLRVAFGWDAIEPERGVYDWSFWDDFVRRATQRHELRLIPYVCYTPKWAAKDSGGNFWRSPPRDPADFGRFMAVIVARYRSQIKSWELWNEPDNSAYWLGTVEEFAALVRAGSDGVRRSNPTATVVLGGIATELKFLDALFRVQRIAPAVDVVNLHNYYETWHPDPIEQLPDYIEDAAEIVRAHGEREPLWLAEAGYSSVGTRARVSDVYNSYWRGEHTDEAQAAALARIVLLGLGTQQLSVIAWYRVNDLVVAQDIIGDDNNRHLGIRRATGEAKPAASAFRQLATLFAQPFRVTELPVEVVETAGTHPLVRAFELRDGRYVVAAWMSSIHQPRPRSPAEPLDDTRRAVLRIQLPVSVGAISVTRATGDAPIRSRANIDASRTGRGLRLELFGPELVVCTVGR
jgi:hypothetical protein